MDNSTGIQIPSGLLPAVSQFKAGELVVFLMQGKLHPPTVSGFVDALVALFDQSPGGVVADPYNESTVSLNDDIEKLRALRVKAAATGKVTFLFRHFEPRFLQATEQADTCFYVSQGGRGLNIEIAKTRISPVQYRGGSVVSFAKVDKPTIQTGRFPYPDDALVVEVFGVRPRDGKTVTAFAIAALLTDALKGSTKKVFLQNAEPVSSAVVGAETELFKKWVNMIHAENIVVVDGNRPRPAVHPNIVQQIQFNHN